MDSIVVELLMNAVVMRALEAGSCHNKHQHHEGIFIRSSSLEQERNSESAATVEVLLEYVFGNNGFFLHSWYNTPCI